MGAHSEPGWLRSTLLAFGALLPLAVALLAREDNGLGPAWSFAASGAGCLLVCLLVRRVDRLSLAALGGLAGLFLLGLWYEVAVSWAWLPDGAVIEATRWVALAAGALAAGLAAGEGYRVARVLVVGATTVAVVIAAWTGLPLMGDGLPATREHGPLGYWNATAACAALAILAGARISYARRWWLQILGAPIGTLAGLCLAATLSRGALGAAAIGVLWIVLWDRRRWRVLAPAFVTVGAVVWGVSGGPRYSEPTVIAGVALCAFGIALANQFVSRPPRKENTGGVDQRRLSFRLALCVVAVIAVASVVAVGGKDGGLTQKPIDDVSGTSRLLNPSVNVRWQWWDEATTTWWRSPIIGHGGDAFSVRRDLDPEKYFVASRPHNLPLQVMVEAGLIGLLILLPALALISRQVLRHRPPKESWSLDASVVWFASGAAITLLAQAVLDWTLGIPTIAALTALFVGVAVTRRATEPAPPAEASRRVFANAMLVPAGLAMFALCLPPLVAGAAVRDAGRHVEDKPGRARWEAAIAWQLMPSAEALMTRVIAAEHDEGEKAAVRVLADGLERLRWDRTAWAAAAPVAASYGEFALENKATTRLAELTPSSRALTPPR